MQLNNKLEITKMNIENNSLILSIIVLLLSCGSDKPYSSSTKNVEVSVRSDSFSIISDTSETQADKDEGQIEEIMTDLIIDDFPQKRPQFYIANNGDSIDYFEYFKSSKCDFPENLKYWIKVSVDSSGNIQLLEIIKKEGIKPKQFDIHEFFKRIIALPAEDDGKKVSFTMIIPLERLKY